MNETNDKSFIPGSGRSQANPNGMPQESPHPPGTSAAGASPAQTPSYEAGAIGDKINDTAMAQQVADMVRLGKVLLDSKARVIITGVFFLVVYDASQKAIKIKVLKEKGWVIMTESTQGYPTVVEAITKRAEEYMDNKRKLIAQAHALETSQAKYTKAVEVADKSLEQLGKIAEEAIKVAESTRQM